MTRFLPLGAVALVLTAGAAGADEFIFEGQPSLERYAVFVSVDRKIVVVDPRTRVAVRILDQRG